MIKSFLLPLLFVSQMVHAAGDLFNNGGGLSEKTILFAYKNLGKYMDLCLKADGCNLNASQKSLLTKIRSSFDDEIKNTDQIQFLSEQKNPGTFIIDGEMKVAKTGNSVSSAIYINTDLIYQKNESGVYEPTPLAQAVAILLHELGHHQGNWAHSDLDLLGIKVSLLLTQKIYVSPLLPWTQNVQVTVINYNIENAFPDVLLSVGNDLLDLTNQYRQVAICPKMTIPIPILPVPDLDLGGKKAKASMLHNLHWTKFQNEKNEDIVKLQLEGNITKKCKDNDDTFLNTQQKLAISFEIKRENDQWTLNTEGLNMSQTSDPWWKLIRLPSGN